MIDKYEVWMFVKFLLLMQVPVYGFYMWCFLHWYSFWIAWLITNFAYAFTMYPVYRKGVFGV